MQKVFNISVTIFGITFAILIMAILSYVGLLDDALAHPAYDNVFGDIIRGLFRISEYVGWYDFGICAISGLISAFTNPKQTRKRRR